MSPADTPRGQSQSLRPTLPAQSDYARSVARFLYTQNPFYLLSVAFVLHGTRLWYREGAGTFDPWPLMGIICGYILLVAATGFVLVRIGKVWDDARSIFLILLLLFVELSLTFDGILVSRPVTGRALLATGLVLAMAVSEGLMIGLRIRMPILYRVPYHLILALLFLYPLAIVTDLGADRSAAVLRIYLFSPVAAGVLLTLLPAIRRGGQYVEDTGTPWRWPWFPWGLFGFLIVCVGLRAYALSLSFDPVLTQQLADAMRMETAFGFYFLVPILLAIAALLLEGGIVTKNRRTQILALAIPVVCLAVSFPHLPASAPYGDFLRRFVSRIGSPVWVSAIGAIVFYGYARARQVRLAGELFWGALLTGSCITRTTIDLPGMVPPQSWALWLIAASQGFAGLKRQESQRVFTAAVCATFAIRSDFLMGLDSHYRGAVTLNLVGLEILGLGALFHDRFARWLRLAGVPLIVAAVFLAAAVPVLWPAALPPWSLPTYLVTLVAITFGYAFFLNSPHYFYAGVVNLIPCTGRFLYELADFLRRLFAWEGAAWFVWGIVWFALAVLISARKAGLMIRLARLVPRVHRNASSRPPTG